MEKAEKCVGEKRQRLHGTRGFRWAAGPAPPEDGPIMGGMLIHYTSHGQETPYASSHWSRQSETRNQQRCFGTALAHQATLSTAHSDSSMQDCNSERTIGRGSGVRYSCAILTLRILLQRA